MLLSFIHHLYGPCSVKNLACYSAFVVVVFSEKIKDRFDMGGIDAAFTGDIVLYYRRFGKVLGLGPAEFAAVVMSI